MADLDVSFVLCDPMLATVFDVRRHTDDVDDKGRTGNTAEEMFEGVIGVIQAADPKDLVRGTDGQYIPRGISIATSFELRSAAEGFQPDVIVWRCTEYLVDSLKPYPQFGEGVYKVMAISSFATNEPAT